MKKCIKIVFVFLLILTFFQHFNVNVVYGDEKFGATYEEYKKKYYANGKWNFDEFLEGMKTKAKSEEKFQKQFEDVKEMLRNEQAVQETTRTDSKASEAYNEIINQLNIAYENKGYAPKLSSGKKATVSINDSAEDKKKYTVDQIKEYRELYGITEETTDEETREIWVKKLKETGSPGDAVTAESIYAVDHSDDVIYQNPGMTDTTKTPAGTIEGVMQDADKFLEKEEKEPINPLDKNEGLQKFSQTISGILMTIGIVIAVIIGGILGIKFMTGAVEQKAEAKQLLIPYIVGCVIVFGAMIIWSTAINLGEEAEKVEETVATEENPKTPIPEGESSTNNEDTKTEGGASSSTQKDNKNNNNPSSSSTSSKGKTTNKKTNVEVRTVLIDRPILMLDKDHYNKAKLKCYIYPTNATNKKIKWTSSKTSVATVDSQGGIKAKAAGTTIITATAANGKKAKCTLTVIRQMTKSNGRYVISEVKWTKEQLESYINNAEGLCKTKDFHSYPEAAAGTFPVYTGNPYNSRKTLVNTYKGIKKDVGISATDYLILTTTMNQRIYFFKKNGAIWELIDEDGTSTGPISRPTEKVCWCADCVVTPNGHTRFDFYLGAMYRTWEYQHKMLSCFEFWQCGIGSKGLEGTGGTRSGSEKESHYSGRALHSNDVPGTESRRFGYPSTHGCVILPTRFLGLEFQTPEMKGKTLVVYGNLNMLGTRMIVY